MNYQRWTMGPEINDYLVSMDPPGTIVDGLIVECGLFLPEAIKDLHPAPNDLRASLS
jgi:hypothetical protein